VLIEVIKKLSESISAKRRKRERELLKLVLLRSETLKTIKKLSESSDVNSREKKILELVLIILSNNTNFFTNFYKQIVIDYIQNNFSDEE
jgi:hypothetical protein